MDTSRVGFGEMIAAAGAVALLVLMSMPWFGGRLSGESRVRVPSKTGWESFGAPFDVLIIAAAAIALGIAAARAMDAVPALPLEQGALVLAGGATALVIIAVRLLDPPGLIDAAVPGVEVADSRRVAAFLALAAAAVVAYGGALQRRDRRARAPA